MATDRLSMIEQIIACTNGTCTRLGDHALIFKSEPIISEPISLIIADSPAWDKGIIEPQNGKTVILIKECLKVEADNISDNPKISIFPYKTILDYFLSYTKDYNKQKEHIKNMLTGSDNPTDSEINYPLIDLQVTDNDKRKIRTLFSYFTEIINSDENGLYITTADFGGGKTFFSYHLLLNEILNEKLNCEIIDRRIPILISGETDIGKFEPKDFIRKAFTDYGFGNLSYEQIRQLQHAGLFVIIFDSIDQLNNQNYQAEEIKALFQELCTLTEKNGQVIITCRDHIFRQKYQYIIKSITSNIKYKQLTILNFTKTEILNSLHNIKLTSNILDKNYNVLKKPLFLSLANNLSDCPDGNPFEFSEYQLLQSDLITWLENTSGIQKEDRLELLLTLFIYVNKVGRNREFMWEDIRQQHLRLNSNIDNNISAYKSALNNFKYLLKPGPDRYKFRFPIFLEFLHIFLAFSNETSSWRNYNHRFFSKIFQDKMTPEALDIFRKYNKSLLNQGSDTLKSVLENLKRQIEETASKKFDDVVFQGTNATSLLFNILQHIDKDNIAIKEDILKIINSINFRDTVLCQTDASETILDNLSFVGTDLREVVFTGSSLMSTVLNNSNLKDIYIQEYGEFTNSLNIYFNSEHYIYIFTTSAGNVFFLNNRLRLLKKAEISKKEITGIRYTYDNKNKIAKAYICDTSGVIDLFRISFSDNEFSIEEVENYFIDSDNLTDFQVIRQLSENEQNRDIIVATTQTGKLIAYQSESNITTYINIQNNSNTWYTSICVIQGKDQNSYSFILGDGEGKISTGEFTLNRIHEIEETNTLGETGSAVLNISQYDTDKIIISCEAVSRNNEINVFIFTQNDKNGIISPLLENITLISNNEENIIYCQKDKIMKGIINEDGSLSGVTPVIIANLPEIENLTFQWIQRINDKLLLLQSKDRVILYNASENKCSFIFNLFMNCQSMQFNGAKNLSCETLVYFLSHGAVVPSRRTCIESGMAEEAFAQINIERKEFKCFGCNEKFKLQCLSKINNGMTFCSNCQ